MATTPPGAPSSPSDPTIGISAERLLEVNAAYEVLIKSYKEFSNILKEQGAESAIKYANAISYAQSKAAQLSDTIDGYSESLQINANKTSESYDLLKRQIKQQSEEVAFLTQNIEKYKAALASIQPISGVDNLTNSIEEARTELNTLFEDLYREGKGRQQLDVLEHVNKLRESLLNIRNDTEAAAATNEQQEEFIKKYITKGVDRKTAERHFGYIKKAIEAEAAATKSATSEQRDALGLKLNIIDAEEKIAAASIRAADAANFLPSAKTAELFSSSLEKTDKNLKNLLERFIGGSSSANLFASAFIASFGKNGIKGILKSIEDSFINVFLSPQNAANGLFNFIDNFLIKSTFKFDETLAQVNKSTGGFRKEFEKIALKSDGFITETKISHLSAYGVNLEKLGKSYADLSKTVGGFNHMLDEERRSLAENAAVFENLGVSSIQYAKSISYFMGVIGQTTEGATASLDKLSVAALSAGKDVGDYIAEFNALSSDLSGFGRDAESIYQNLNAISQATKGVVTATDLVSLSKQFDTFEKALSTSARLSGVLKGVSLDAKQLIDKDAAEIALAVKRAVNAKYGSFSEIKEMGLRRELAEIFGSMAKAQAIINMDLQKMTAELGNQTEAARARNERMKESNSAMKQFETAIENVKLSLTPLLKVFTGLTNIINGIVSVIGAKGAFATGVIGMITLFNLAVARMSRSISDAFAASFAKIRLEITETSTLANNAVNKLSMSRAGTSVFPVVGAPGAPGTPGRGGAGGDGGSGTPGRSFSVVPVVGSSPTAPPPAAPTTGLASRALSSLKGVGGGIVKTIAQIALISLISEGMSRFAEAGANVDIPPPADGSALPPTAIPTVNPGPIINATGIEEPIVPAPAEDVVKKPGEIAYKPSNSIIQVQVPPGSSTNSNFIIPNDGSGVAYVTHEGDTVSAFKDSRTGKADERSPTVIAPNKSSKFNSLYNQNNTEMRSSVSQQQQNQLTLTQEQIQQIAKAIAIGAQQGIENSRVIAVLESRSKKDLLEKSSEYSAESYSMLTTPIV